MMVCIFTDVFKTLLYFFAVFYRGKIFYKESYGND